MGAIGIVTQETESTITPEEAATAEAEELASFDATFGDTSEDGTLPVVPPITQDPVTEVPTPTVSDVPAPFVPKMAQISEEQLAKILTFSTDLAEIKQAMESRFGTAFGKIGSMSQTLKELQTMPESEPLTVTAEDLAHMKDNYPDLTPAIEKTFKNVLSRVKPGSTRTVTQQVDQESLKPLVVQSAKEAVTELFREEQAKELNEEYPNWETTIGPQGSTTAFRQWLANEPADYQTKVNTAQRATVIVKALNRFTGQVTPPKTNETTQTTRLTPAQMRQAQLNEAVTERGNASQQTAKSEEDAFNEVFAGK